MQRMAPRGATRCVYGYWHRPSYSRAWPGSYGATAFILSLVALFLTPLLQRGLRIAPPLRCAGPGPRVVRSCPSPVGRAHPILKRSNNFLVFGAPASLTGSELPGYRLRPFALLLSYGARSAQAD